MSQSKSQELVTSSHNSKQGFFANTNAFQLANYSMPNRIESETKLSDIQREVRRQNVIENQKNARFDEIWRRRCETIRRSSTDLAAAAREHQNILSSLLPLLKNEETDDTNENENDDKVQENVDNNNNYNEAEDSHIHELNSFGGNVNVEGDRNSGKIQYGVIKTLVSRLFTLHKKYMGRTRSSKQNSKSKILKTVRSLFAASPIGNGNSNCPVLIEPQTEGEITTILRPSSSVPIPSIFSIPVFQQQPNSISNSNGININNTSSSLNISTEQQQYLRDLVFQNSASSKHGGQEFSSYSTNKSASWRNFTYDTYEYWTEISEVTLSLVTRNHPPRLEVTRKESPVEYYTGPFEGIILNGFCVKGRTVTAPCRPGRIHAYGLGVELSGMDANTFLYSFSNASILLAGKKCGQSNFLFIKIDKESHHESETGDGDIEYQPASEETKNTAWFNIFYDPHNC